MSAPYNSQPLIHNPQDPLSVQNLSYNYGTAGTQEYVPQGAQTIPQIHQVHRPSTGVSLHSLHSMHSLHQGPVTAPLQSMCNYGNVPGMIPQYSNPPSAGVHPLQTSLQPLHTAPPPPPPPPPPPLPLHYHRPRVPILAINDDPMLSADPSPRVATNDLTTDRLTDSAMSWLGIDKETKQPFDGTPDNVSNLKAKSDVDLTWIRLVGSKPDNVNILDDFTAEEIGKIDDLEKHYRHSNRDSREKRDQKRIITTVFAFVVFVLLAWLIYLKFLR